PPRRSSPEARSGSAAQTGVVSAIRASSAVRLAGAEARTDAKRRLVMRAMADSMALIFSQRVHHHAANGSTAALRWHDGATTRRHDVSHVAPSAQNTKLTKLTKLTKSGPNISGFSADADVGPA